MKTIEKIALNSTGIDNFKINICMIHYIDMQLSVVYLIDYSSYKAVDSVYFTADNNNNVYCNFNGYLR